MTTMWEGGLSKLGKGYSREQIIRKLRQGEDKLGSGSTVPEMAMFLACLGVEPCGFLPCFFASRR